MDVSLSNRKKRSVQPRRKGDEKLPGATVIGRQVILVLVENWGVVRTAGRCKSRLYKGLWRCPFCGQGRLSEKVDWKCARNGCGAETVTWVTKPLAHGELQRKTESS
jgi:hypothetical protein